jgi:hypothetical protein
MSKILEQFEKVRKDQLINIVYRLHDKLEAAEDEAMEQAGICDRVISLLTEMMFSWYPEEELEMVRLILSYYSTDIQVEMICAVYDYHLRGEIKVFNTEVKRVHFRKLCVMMAD